MWVATRTVTRSHDIGGGGENKVGVEATAELQARCFSRHQQAATFGAEHNAGRWVNQPGRLGARSPRVPFPRLGAQPCLKAREPESENRGTLRQHAVSRQEVASARSYKQEPYSCWRIGQKHQGLAPSFGTCCFATRYSRPLVHCRDFAHALREKLCDGVLRQSRDDKSKSAVMN